MLTIQEVARKFEIKTNKLRFYEDKGLLSPMRDPKSGYRLYSEEDILRLQLILIYRSLEVPVKTIGEILQNDCQGQTMTHLYTQWQVVNEKMRQYRMLQEKIEYLIDGHLDPSRHPQAKSTLLTWHQEAVNWRDRWHFDEWASSYDQSVEANEGSLNIYGTYDTLLEMVCEMAKVQLPKKATLLDIGVGTGNLGSKFLDGHTVVYGVDQSKEMLYQAKLKYPELKLRLGEMTQLPFEDKAFDCLVSTYAFHHLQDDQKTVAFREMCRVLKDHGQMLIGDLMFESLASKDELMAQLTDDECAIIEDEYYTIIEKFGQVVEAAGYGYTYEQVDRFLYMMCIRK